MTPIFYCNPQIGELLLKHGARIEVRDGRGQTALMNAAYSLSLEQIKWLLGRGADVNACDNAGLSAMAWALQGQKIVGNVPAALTVIHVLAQAKKRK